MKLRTKIFLLFIINCSLLIVNCYAQWLQQTSGVTSGFQDCDFINQNTGWVCGNSGVIIKTTNGGANWVQQNSGVSKILLGIEAIDENLLWCVGQWNTILKSTDGGNNWLVLRDGPTSSPNFYKPFFLNPNTGWMLMNNYILRTTNGGITFDSTNTVFTFLRDIYFKDAITGVLCGNGSLIMKSTDRGVTWAQITIPLHNFSIPDFYRMTFINLTGWVVAQGSSFGLGKLAYRTTNFGDSWDTISRVPYPNNEENYSVYFSSLNTGYCGGTTGYTFKTINGGFNWYQQVVPSNGYRGDFYFINDTLGWSIGGGGQIFKTTNGGTYVGIEQISSVIPDNFILYQNFPNPFNPSTTILFEIPEYENIRLSVFDLLGKEISVLINDKLKSGKYCVTFDGSEYTSGIYFYRLRTANLLFSKKMILIK